MTAIIGGSHRKSSPVKEQQGCIYYARNTVNGKGYVGKHSTPEAKRRWCGHAAQARRGSKYIFHCALRKYGVAAFTWEVIWRGPVSMLNAKEVFFIKKRNTCVDNPAGGYNLTYGGEGGVPSEFTRKKRAKAIKAAWMGQTAKRTKHGLMLQTVFARPDQKEQRSILRKLDWKKPEYRAKMAKRVSGMRGKVHTAEARAALSEATKLWFQSMTPEQREANSLARSTAQKLVWQNRSTAKRKAFSSAVEASWAYRKRTS